MEQTERIKTMEQHLDRAASAVMKLAVNLAVKAAMTVVTTKNHLNRHCSGRAQKLQALRQFCHLDIK